MSTAKNKPEEDNLYDLEQVQKPESTVAPMIDQPGILHNLKIKFEKASGDYKDQAKNPGQWHAFKTTITDTTGLELTEVYFSPPQKVSDVDPARPYPLKKVELVDNKMAETRVCTELEELKILNNEFLSYLIDAGEAIGYSYNDVKEYLYKNAKGFEALCDAFLAKFPVSENARVSAKVLWNNNNRKQTSFLMIHGPYTRYYPWNNDLLDVWKEGKPTQLALKKTELTNGMVKKYTGLTDAPPAGGPTVAKGGAPLGGYQAAVDSIAGGDEPF